MTGGSYQLYDKTTPSQWQRLVTDQLEKALQPCLSDVHVDWLQTDDNATPLVQAPSQIPSLFSSCRQVVYGFVENCTQV